MNLRRLGKAGLLLVNRLGHHDARVVAVQVQEQRRAVPQHGDKLLVADPGRIEQDIVAEMAYLVDDVAGVVQRAVVGAELNDGQAEGPRLLRLFRVPFGSQLAQVGFVEAMGVDAADKAVGIAGRFQIYRRRPGLDEGADGYGFMVVPVVQHQVARRQQGVRHDLIGRRRAVEDEIGLIGVEHLGSKILGFQGRPFMDEQIAQRNVGVAYIRLENMGTVEIIEIASRRMLLEKFAVLMARAVEGIVFFAHVLYEVGEKGRQDKLLVVAGQPLCRRNAAALVDHFLRNDGVDLADIFFRKPFAARHDNHDGNAEARRVDLVDVGEVLVGQHGDGYVGKVRLFDRHDFPVAVYEVVLYVKAVRYL